MAVTKRRLSRRRTPHHKVTALKESTRDEARKAVILACKKALLSARCDPTIASIESYEAGTVRRRLPSLDFSQDSNPSTFSHEMAIRRGSRRGFCENNEVLSATPSLSDGASIDYDMTTVTDTRMSSVSGHNKDRSRKWKFFGKRRKSSKTKHDGPLSAEITQEAWMCGVCAKSFASWEAAEKHEDYHIKEVVMDLGWIRDNQIQNELNNIELPNFDSGVRKRNKSEPKPAPLTPDRSLSPSQPRPDVLKKSTSKPSHISTSRVGFENDDPIAPLTPDRSLSPSQPRPDVLKKSTSKPSHLSTSRVGFQHDDPILESQNYNGEPFFTSSIPKRFSKQQDFPLMSAIDESADENDLLVPYRMREYVVLADEALVDVCAKAEPLILTQSEVEAELELEWLAKDKSYYDLISERALKREKEGTYNRFRTEGKTMLNKVQNKFVDAYQLMKEGNIKDNASMDHYNRKARGSADTQGVIAHSQRTLYVNVIVKQSIQVVSHELQRLAKKRWEDAQTAANAKASTGSQARTKGFQKFRAVAQGNLVKLAGYALASDFTPRRIAIQLSNDLYRLLTPRLKKRGVTLETEIEYRVGPYFVLAVNIKTIDWAKLIKMTHRDVAERKSKWKRAQSADDVPEESKPAGVLVSFAMLCFRLSRLTRYEVLAQILAWLYYVHWAISIPLCFLSYHLFLGTTFRTYFLSSVADEIFFYVEEKGMDMEVDIRDAATQAAFMLSALRELRADGRELKKKRKESESASEGTLLGPLLGPAISQDKGPAPSKPANFELPDNLEFIGLELDIPVGFQRLRWALLCSKATFLSDAVFRAESKYENITIGDWTEFNDAIGLPNLPEGVNEEDFIGVEKESSYLMPKSAFVKANMCYETAYVETYNDYCFCLKKKALTPEVPYGSTFVAWTKYVVINTGNDTCKMICSVEPEFPNGPPLISRQIKSGMRAGVTELFVQIGETITKYADEFPP